MLTKELNELITQVGPGTPGGEYMRRYWHPVGLSTDVITNGQPKQIRILGEDLVLFRDQAGRPGLVGRLPRLERRSIASWPNPRAGASAPAFSSRPWKFFSDRTMCRRLAERPTTSWPASTRSEAIPSRRRALSSATTTRTGRTLFTAPRPM